MKYIGKGVTRHVFLTENYAFKIPRLNYGWQMFLYGLLANLQEKKFSVMDGAALCPVLFSFPLGFLNVMPRTAPLSDDEWAAMKDRQPDIYIPTEHKRDSYGWLNGKIVGHDYGNAT